MGQAAPGGVLGSPQAAGRAPGRGLLADAGVEEPPGFLESRCPRGLPFGRTMGGGSAHRGLGAGEAGMAGRQAEHWQGRGQGTP